MLPLASSSAFLQSSRPAPVFSRSSATIPAEITDIVVVIGWRLNVLVADGGFFGAGGPDNALARCNRGAFATVAVRFFGDRGNCVAGSRGFRRDRVLGFRMAVARRI